MSRNSISNQYKDLSRYMYLTISMYVYDSSYISLQYMYIYKEINLSICIYITNFISRYPTLIKFLEYICRNLSIQKFKSNLISVNLYAEIYLSI